MHQPKFIWLLALATQLMVCRFGFPQEVSNERAASVLNARVGAEQSPTREQVPVESSSIDLLARIDIPRDTVAGIWDFAGQALYGKSDSGLSMIRIPHDSPSEYDLQLVVERVAGCDQFTIGLLAGTAHFAVSLDRGGGRWSDLYGEVEVRGGLFRSYRPATIDIEVRRDGLAVKFDNDLVYAWKGDLRTVRMHPLWKQHLDGQRTIFLEQCNAQFVVHRMVLTPK